MAMKIINDPANYKITPRQIDTKRHFWDGFGNREREISAHYIVLLCQQLGKWGPFTMEQLDKVYTPGDGFWFNGLDTQGYIVYKNGKYYITEEFVNACYSASPA
jgi:hypothetical protein